MNRRRFLTQVGGIAAGAQLARAGESPRASAVAPAGALVDTNVFSSHWAVRHSWAETPALLAEKLRRCGVTSAWVGSFEGALHSDISGANTRLADACAQAPGGTLRPFGTVNPTLPDWEEDLRRCHEGHRMAGVRLFPSYHGYLLDDARFARLIDLAAQRLLLVQVVMSIEDERSQNPVLQAAPVQAAPLADLLPKFPAARLMLLNSTNRVLGGNAPLLGRLVAAGVSFEIATLEGVAGIEALLQRAPGIRLCFGSHVPYFYFEAAWMKLEESALTPRQLAAIRSEHAQAALATGRASVRVGPDAREPAQAV